jgi:hypothetical protein
MFEIPASVLLGMNLEIIQQLLQIASKRHKPMLISVGVNLFSFSVMLTESR